MCRHDPYCDLDHTIRECVVVDYGRTGQNKRGRVVFRGTTVIQCEKWIAGLDPDEWPGIDDCRFSIDASVRAMAEYDRILARRTAAA